MCCSVVSLVEAANVTVRDLNLMVTLPNSSGVSLTDCVNTTVLQMSITGSESHNQVGLFTSNSYRIVCSALQVCQTTIGALFIAVGRFVFKHSEITQSNKLGIGLFGCYEAELGKLIVKNDVTGIHLNSSESVPQEQPSINHGNYYNLYLFANMC